MKNLFIVNLNKDKSKYSSYLSTTLLNKIDLNLLAWKKSLIYINKKWEYSSVICNSCEYLYKCPNCDISLTIHRYPSSLKCHYCSHTENIPKNCKKCWKSDFTYIWIWTEQIQDIFQKIYSKAKIYRMDTNTITSVEEKKSALNNINNSDIIIWTKMITTWFNFNDLGLIWIILLEQELQIPEYNTEEKVYQNIKQLIWRWWRVNQETDILIQTLIPNNNIVKQLTELNYKDFFIETIKERKIFNYPPFCELKTIKYKDFSEDKAFIFMEKLEKKLINLDTNSNFDIKLVPNSIKRNKQYNFKIIIKWHKINDFLQSIKEDILKNKDLSIY